MYRSLLKMFVIIGFLNSCIAQKNVSDVNKSDMISGVFTINKIDDTASFHLIYVIKDNNTYKIISRKTESLKDLEKIELNKSYKLKLVNYLELTKSDNPLTGFSSSDPCFMLDDGTEICREKDVLGIYGTDDLKGLYYKK
jgi:hypothetical protein